MPNSNFKEQAGAHAVRQVIHEGGDYNHGHNKNVVRDPNFDGEEQVEDHDEIRESRDHDHSKYLKMRVPVLV